MRTGRPLKVSDEDLIRVWESASTAREAAELLGLHPRTAGMRAQRLRDRGVPMRKFPPGPPKSIDVEALTELVKKVRRER